jgi:phage gp29-like protein
MPNPFRHLRAFAAESAEAVASLLPLKRVTVVNNHYEPPAIAQRMDADRIAAIFRAAEAGDTRDYFALIRDIVAGDGYVQNLIATRKLAVLGDVLSIQPGDKTRAEDADTAAMIRGMIDAYDAQSPAGAVEFEQFTPWLNALAALMDGHLYPVSVTEKVWRPALRPGVRFELQALVPVPHHLLDYTTGRLMILDVDESGAPLGTRHAPDPERYIVHRGHLLSLPDNWGGPIRSVAMWWLLTNLSRTWWARFLEHYGSPFAVGKADDDDGQRVLRRAFAMFRRLGGLVVSKNTEIELMQAAAQQSGEAFKTFRDVGRREIAIAILGQSGTVEGTPGKLGSEKAQELVRQDFRAWDAVALARTLKGQLFAQAVRINAARGAVPKVQFGSVSPDEKKVLGELLKSLKDGGLEPTDDALIAISEELGMQVRRVAAVAPPNLGGPLAQFSPALFTAGLAVMDQQGVDAVAKQKAADLASALRGSLAPIRNIVLHSATPEEALAKVEAFCAGMDPRKATALSEVALAILTAKGAASQAPK